MSKANAEDLPESDAFEGAPHPRSRPRLIGHDAAEAAILEAYRSGKLAHAWLIGGPEGVGKATLAWRFARFVLCHPDPNAPVVSAARDLSVNPQHLAARMLAAGSHPDFRLVRRGWDSEAKRLKTEIAKADIDEALGLFHLSASSGGWRVCLIDCAEDLNQNGANALLKMIEEPPQRALILIIAHRPGQVLATIRSRCRKLLLAPLAPGAIATIVAELGEPWRSSPPEQIEAAARLAQGSVREALRRLDPATMAISAQINAAVARLPRSDLRAAHRLADQLSSRAAQESFGAFNLALYDWLADRARSATNSRQREAISALWERLRAATRETESLNLDRKLHVLSVLADFAERADIL